MEVIDEVFVRKTRWFFHEVVRKEVRIRRFLSNNFRVEGAKVVIIQFRCAISFRGDINRLIGPVDPRIVLLEPRHTEDNVFFTTVRDIEQDFMGDSANAEEKCGRKLNFSTRVNQGIDVSDSDGEREFSVGKTIFLDKVVIKAVDTCPRIDESAG